MLTLVKTFEAIHIYVMITQMYVQGHGGDTNPAVSTVPPTGGQCTGSDKKYQAEGHCTWRKCHSRDLVAVNSRTLME